MGMRIWTHFGRILVGATLLVAVSPRGVNGEILYWADNPGALDFTVDANWALGVTPGAGDIPVINGVDGINDYAYIDTSVEVQRFTLAELFGQSGGIELRNGAILTTNVNALHYVGARGTGHLRIQNGASMSLAGPLYLGWGSGSGHGNGTVLQTGGSYSGTSLVIGHLAEVPNDTVQIGSVGTYTLDSGSINLSSAATVGNAGTGTFNMNGGTLDTNANIIVGNSGTGMFHLASGGVSTGFNSNGYLQIGRTGTGAVQQTGGTMAVNRVHADPGVVIASHTGGVGTYEISGGSFTVAASNGGVTLGTTSNSSTGTLRIIGDDSMINIGTNYRQDNPSALELEIDSGISAINVGGDATLGGLLQVSFTETPTVNQQFTIMNYGGTLNGTFTTFDNFVDGPGGPDSIGLSIDYGTGFGSSVVLTVLDQMLGDFDMMNGVNEVDFWILSDHLNAHFEGPVTYANGDINNDGKVDLDDFGIFKDLYPAVVASALGESVPEPSSVILFCLAGLAGLLAIRRSGRR